MVSSDQETRCLMMAGNCISHTQWLIAYEFKITVVQHCKVIITMHVLRMPYTCYIDLLYYVHMALLIFTQQQKVMQQRKT